MSIAFLNEEDIKYVLNNCTEKSNQEIANFLSKKKKRTISATLISQYKTRARSMGVNIPHFPKTQKKSKHNFRNSMWKKTIMKEMGIDPSDI